MGAYVPNTVHIKRTKTRNIDDNRLRRRRTRLIWLLTTQSRTFESRHDFVMRAAELRYIEDELCRRGMADTTRKTINLRKIIPAILLVLTVMFAAACYPTWGGSVTGRRVGVYTDSIGTDSYAGTEIDNALKPTYGELRYSHSGWRYDQLLPSADALVGDPQAEQITVVELGTNDAIQIASGTWTLDQAKTSIDRWLAEFPNDCVVFVEPSVRTLNLKVNAASADINAYLTTLASPNVVLYDWSADILALYNSDPSHPYPFVDGVHPTQPGQDMLAAGIKKNVEACP